MDLKTRWDKMVEEWISTDDIRSDEEKYPPYLLKCQKRCCVDMRMELRIKGRDDGKDI